MWLVPVLGPGLVSDLAGSAVEAEYWFSAGLEAGSGNGAGSGGGHKPSARPSPVPKGLKPDLGLSLGPG